MLDPYKITFHGLDFQGRIVLIDYANDEVLLLEESAVVCKGFVVGAEARINEDLRVSVQTREFKT